MKGFAEIQGLINQGRYLEARSVAEEQHAKTPGLECSRLYGLALSKSGMPENALDILESLQRTYPDDAETAGILGGVYKELFKKNQQTSYAVQSRDTYLRNFQATKSYYTGINAAAMSAILMQGAKARELAAQVAASISPTTENFWELATLAEAHLLMKSSEASDYYTRARKAGGTDWGKIGSVFNQLSLYNNYIPVKKEILKLFHPPGIVAFVGHMIDHPSRPEPRFPPSIEPQVKNAIVNTLQTINANIGYCSLACGGDILFAEAMLELGREVNLFLPFAPADFIETSLRFAGEQWVERFQNLIEKFPATVILDDKYGGMDELFDHQSKVIFGSAILRSLHQQNKTTLLTVLSETDLNRKVGGTHSSISHWPGNDHVNINPDLFHSSNSSLETSLAKPPAPVSRDINRKPFSFLLFDLSRIQAFDRDKISKKLLLDPSEGVIKIDPGAHLVAYAFESELLAYDLVSHHLNDQNIRIIMHWGVGHSDHELLDCDAMQTIMHLNTVLPTGIYLTEFVAATISLHRKKHSLIYSGPVRLPDERKVSIYNLKAAH